MMRRAALFLLVLLAITLLACGGSQRAEEDWGRTFVGSWEGTGRRQPVSMTDDPWRMVAEIENTETGPCGRVQYPSLGCRGIWVCQPGFDGRILVARERITEGSACVDGGVIEMELLDDGTLEWRHSSGDVRSLASLSRPLDERVRMQ
jgi:hypothetical protein